MASIKVKQEYKELVKLFNQLTGSRSLWQVFNDCIEIMALSIQNTFCFGINFSKNETRYKDIIKNYSDNEIDVILHIFAEITNMIEKIHLEICLVTYICNLIWVVIRLDNFSLPMLFLTLWQKALLTK